MVNNHSIASSHICQSLYYYYFQNKILKRAYKITFKDTQVVSSSNKQSELTHHHEAPHCTSVASLSSCPHPPLFFQFRRILTVRRED